MGLTGKERGNVSSWKRKEACVDCLLLNTIVLVRRSGDVNRKSRVEMFDSHVPAGAFPVPSLAFLLHVMCLQPRLSPTLSSSSIDGPVMRVCMMRLHGVARADEGASLNSAEDALRSSPSSPSSDSALVSCLS